MQGYLDRNVSPELASAVKLVLDEGPNAVLAAAIRITSLTVKCEKDADVRLSTVHKAKGLEFDVVMVGDDLCSPFDLRVKFRDLPQEVFDEEANLLYVAITRAKRLVFLSGAQSAYVAGGRGWFHTFALAKVHKGPHDGAAALSATFCVSENHDISLSPVSIPAHLQMATLHGGQLLPLLSPNPASYLHLAIVAAAPPQSRPQIVVKDNNAPSTGAPDPLKVDLRVQTHCLASLCQDCITSLWRRYVRHFDAPVLRLLGPVTTV
jgi:hypothetical protein